MSIQIEHFIEFLVICCVGFGLSVIAYNLFDDKYYLQRLKERIKK